MSETRWKYVERLVARYFGGKRVPITGRQRGSAPDIAHDWLAFEVKDRKALPEWLLDAMEQARLSATEGQLPIVVLHQRGMFVGDCPVVIRARDFVEWFGKAGPA